DDVPGEPTRHRYEPERQRRTDETGHDRDRPRPRGRPVGSAARRRGWPAQRRAELGRMTPQAVVRWKWSTGDGRVIVVVGVEGHEWQRYCRVHSRGVANLTWCYMLQTQSVGGRT